MFFEEEDSKGGTMNRTGASSPVPSLRGKEEQWASQIQLIHWVSVFILSPGVDDISLSVVGTASW